MKLSLIFVLKERLGVVQFSVMDLSILSLPLEDYSVKSSI